MGMVGRVRRSVGPVPDELPTIAVFDIDGVIADVRHRLRFVERAPKDWDSFFGCMDEDGPLEDGIALARTQAEAGHRLVYLTGRNESYRALTLDWMQRYDVPEGRLVMRPNHDRRPARQFKPQALQRLAERSRIVAVVDDDAAVIEVLRRDGWPVLHATWMPQESGEQQALFDAQEVDGRA
jgi:hypothetical protein